MFCHSRFDYKDNREAEETETELKRVVNDQQKQISNLRAQVSCWEAWPAQNLNRVWKYLHKCWWRSSKSRAQWHCLLHKIWKEFDNICTSEGAVRADQQFKSWVALLPLAHNLHRVCSCTAPKIAHIHGGRAGHWWVAAVFPVQYNICTIGGGRSDKTFFEYSACGDRTMFMPEDVSELPYKVNISPVKRSR